MEREYYIYTINNAARNPNTRIVHQKHQQLTFWIRYWSQSYQLMEYLMYSV